MSWISREEMEEILRRAQSNNSGFFNQQTGSGFHNQQANAYGHSMFGSSFFYSNHAQTPPKPKPTTKKFFELQIDQFIWFEDMRKKKVIVDFFKKLGQKHGWTLTETASAYRWEKDFSEPKEKTLVPISVTTIEPREDIRE